MTSSNVPLTSLNLNMLNQFLNVGHLTKLLLPPSSLSPNIIFEEVYPFSGIFF